MPLLDLPLELFGGIIDIVVLCVQQNRYFSDTVLLVRLVNRIFNREVLLSFSRTKTMFSDALRWHASDSRSEFMASVLLAGHNAGSFSIRDSYAALMISLAIDLTKTDEGHGDMKKLLYHYMRTLCYRVPHLSAERLFESRGAEFLSDANARFNHSLLAAIFAGKILLATSMLQDSTIDVPAIYSELLGSPLYAAVLGGHRELALQLLERGADPNKISPGDFASARRPLLAAAVNDDEELLWLILEPKYGCDTSIVSFHGPIMTYLKRNQPAMASSLLERLTTPLSECDVMLYSGLLSACEHGMADIVRLLLDHGASPIPERQAALSSPVDLAVWGGHETVLRILLERGAPPCGNTLIDDGIAMRSYHSMCSVIWSGNLRTFRILLEGGLRLGDFAACEWKMILEIGAYSKKSMYSIKSLFEEGLLNVTKLGADATESMVSACQILLAACRHGSIDYLRLLVQYGVILDTTFYLEHELAPPLVEAIAYRQKGIITPLLELGATEYDPLETVYRENFISGVLPRDPNPVLCGMPTSPLRHFSKRKFRGKFVEM